MNRARQYQGQNPVFITPQKGCVFIAGNATLSS
jgi:hypothetical protein